MAEVVSSVSPSFLSFHFRGVKSLADSVQMDVSGSEVHVTVCPKRLNPVNKHLKKEYHDGSVSIDPNGARLGQLQKSHFKTTTNFMLRDGVRHNADGNAVYL